MPCSKKPAGHKSVMSINKKPASIKDIVTTTKKPASNLFYHANIKIPKKGKALFNKGEQEGWWCQEEG